MSKAINPLLAAAKGIPTGPSEKMNPEELRQVREVAKAVADGIILATPYAIWKQVIREKLTGKCSRERWLRFVEEARAAK